MDFLFCSVGRRGELIKDFKLSLDKDSKIIATDCINTAPALYFADKQYIVPKITDKRYIPMILEICKGKYKCNYYIYRSRDRTISRKIVNF